VGCCSTCVFSLLDEEEVVVCLSASFGSYIYHKRTLNKAARTLCFCCVVEPTGQSLRQFLTVLLCAWSWTELNYQIKEGGRLLCNRSCLR
jgi:hypothetical protein